MSRNIKKMVEARYYVVNKFYPQGLGLNFVRNRALSKIHYDLGVDLLREDKLNDARREFCQAVKFWPFSFLVWLGFVKTFLRVRVK